MKAPLTPLIILILIVAAHAALFGRVYQGVFYFALLALGLVVLKKNASFLSLSLPVLAVFMDSFGNYKEFYGRLSWFDDLSHALISALLFFFLLSVGRSFMKTENYFAYGIFALAATISLGAIYEIFEYWATVFGARMIWGEFDSASDLQWNLVGAGCAFIIWMAKTKIASLRS